MRITRRQLKRLIKEYGSSYSGPSESPVDLAGLQVIADALGEIVSPVRYPTADGVYLELPYARVRANYGKGGYSFAVSLDGRRWNRYETPEEVITYLEKIK